MKKYCIISGSRGDYDLLSPIIKSINNIKNIKLFFFVTGTHLNKSFGNSLEYIKKDRVRVNEKIKVLNKNFDDHDINYYISKLILEFSKKFKKYRPDILIVLGDRYEIFASVIAATYLKIPIAHLCGGDLSFGSIDHNIRNSISCMSHLHFVTNILSKKNLLKFVKNKNKIFNFGSTGIENLKNTEFLNKKNIEQKLKIKLLKKNILVNFHPTSYDNGSIKSQIQTILKALSHFPKYGIFFTYPNADAHNNTVIKIIDDFKKKNSQNVKIFKFLGRKLFFSLAKHCDIILGNSSSSIIEMPYLNKVSINLGIRQLGRLKSNLTIDCNIDEKEIISKIRSNINKKKILHKKLYGNGSSSAKIIYKINKFNLKKILINK